MNYQVLYDNSLRKKEELLKEIEEAEKSIRSFMDSKEYGLIYSKLDRITSNFSQLEELDAQIMFYREQKDLEVTNGSY